MSCGLVFPAILVMKTTENWLRCKPRAHRTLVSTMTNRQFSVTRVRDAKVRVPDEDGRDCNVSTTREECGVSAICRSGSRNPGIHDVCSQSAVRNAHSLSALPLENAAPSHPKVESAHPLQLRNSPAGREARSDGCD